MLAGEDINPYFPIKKEQFSFFLSVGQVPNKDIESLYKKYKEYFF